MTSRKLHDQVCIVVWRDAASHDRWEDTSYYRSTNGTVECITVGFLLEDTPEQVKLVRTCHLHDNDQSEGMFAIPKGMVVSMQIIKPRKPRKGKTPDVIIGSI